MRTWSIAVMTSLAVVFASALGACDSRRDFPPAGSASQGSGMAGFDPGLGGQCADGLCGNQLHELSFDVPNVYFVLDASGSMAAPVTSGSESRYRLVREAALDMIRSLGSLINVGAAIFPLGDLVAEPCHAGGQVLEVTPGDPLGDGTVGGPTSAAFGNATDLSPNGGTPVASTLVALRPTLSAMSGRTIVLLLTDGGPNCNALASCGVSECMPNIEGVCPPTDNCCTPGHPQGGPELCVDRQPTVDAIAAIAALGIDVYVIGIPGSEIYASVLDDMALAGGKAQTGSPRYHRVDDLDALAGVFKAIAAENVSCQIRLDEPPAMQGFTNVYFDCDIVPFDPLDGWDWYEGDSVWLHGDACRQLRSGEVAEVKVATGCPSELPN